MYDIIATDEDERAVHVALDDDFRLPSSSDGREQNIPFLQEALGRALDSVAKHIIHVLSYLRSFQGRVTSFLACYLRVQIYDVTSSGV